MPEIVKKKEKQQRANKEKQSKNDRGGQRKARKPKGSKAKLSKWGTCRMSRLPTLRIHQGDRALYKNGKDSQEESQVKNSTIEKNKRQQ